MNKFDRYNSHGGCFHVNPLTPKIKPVTLLTVYLQISTPIVLDRRICYWIN